MATSATEAAAQPTAAPTLASGAAVAPATAAAVTADAPGATRSADSAANQPQPGAVAALASPAPTATTAAPQVSSPSAAVPMPPHEQVAQALLPVVGRLRQMAGGSQQITVYLHPAELGSVTVQVALQQGSVTVHLAAAHDAARELLRGAVHQLRADLAAGGVQTTSIDVGAHSAGGGADHAAGRFGAGNGGWDGPGSSGGSGAGSLHNGSTSGWSGRPDADGAAARSPSAGHSPSASIDVHL